EAAVHATAASFRAGGFTAAVVHERTRVHGELMTGPVHLRRGNTPNAAGKHLGWTVASVVMASGPMARLPTVAHRYSRRSVPGGEDMIDTGNTAWLLMSAALVMLMTPGLAFFYGGMSRAKSVLN